MEKKAKTDSRISIILAIYDVEKNKSSYESLFTVISKAKTDLECILISSNNTDSSFITKHKIVAELVAKHKALLIQVDKNATLGDQYAKALNEASGSYSLIVENPSAINFGNLTSWISSNKKNIQENDLWVGSPSSTKWINKLYNSAVRFWTPLNLRDHTSGILVVKTEFAATLFETKLGVAQNHLQVLHIASCSGLSLKEFTFPNDKPPASKGLGNILFIPFTAFLLRWKYFIPGSLREMKVPEKPSFRDGNHPVYRFTFFTLILLATFAMPYLSGDFGITWDERQHNDYSQLAYKWMATMGEDTAAIADPKGGSEFIRQSYRYYGEQSNLISAILYNTFDLPPFETRHFVISLYGLLGLICIALAAKELGGWRAGIIALLFTFFNPGWLGNSMNNPTDIPFAAGFAFSLYFLIKILKALPKPKFAHLIWLGIGIGIGVGSRIGAILIMAYFGLFLGIQWLSLFRDKKSNPWKLILPYARLLLIAVIAGYICGIVLWPYGLEHPFRNPLIAFQKSSDNVSFYTNNVELFEGKRLYMRDQAPWYYVFKFLTIANPIYLLLGFVLPVVVIRWMKEKISIGFIVMLYFMVLFPILYAEYSDLNYYNGWRHYLFLLPGWITLAAVSFDYLLGAKNKVVQYITLVVVAVLFAKPTYWIIKNHPNEYVYFNELVGGVNGAYGHYETDYYSNSCRAAAEWIAKQEPNKKLVVAINNEPLTGSYYAQKINPNLEFIWVREYEEQKPMWDYLILTTRTYSKNELLNGSFPPKGTVHMIMVDDIPLAAIVKRENYFMPLGYKANDAHNADSAIYYFTEAVRYDDKNEENYRMLGQAYINKGSLDTAEIYIDKAIAIFPENYSAWSNKGLIYLNRQEYDKAVSYFDNALKLKHNLTEAYYYAAMCKLTKNSDYTGAIPYLEGALKNNGQAPEIYYNLGICYLNIGRYNKAEEAFSGAITMNPRMANAYRGLAETYTKLNKQEEANYCMQKYQELGGQ